MADKIEIPIPDYIREVAMVAAERAARIVIDEHAKNCRFNKDEYPKRIANLELRFAAFIGCMVGSGVIGGVASSFLTKLLGL